MKINARESEIVQLVDQERKILVKDLAERLNVSEVTIRKDLDKLESCGIIIRRHGYALKKNTADITNRLSINYETKCRIAKKACSLIDDNETVIIGSGSTCALLAEEIAKTKPGITIITNSIYIVDHVSKLGNNKVILLGGEYQKDAQVMIGPLVRSCVKQYFVNKIFLGTDGFMKNVGFMGSNTLRTEAITNMAESASNIIILTDSSKFNKRGLLVQFRESQIYEIITDKGISDDLKGFFVNHGIKLITVM